MLYYSYLYYS